MYKIYYSNSLNQNVKTKTYKTAKAAYFFFISCNYATILKDDVNLAYKVDGFFYDSSFDHPISLDHLLPSDEYATIRHHYYFLKGSSSPVENNCVVSVPHISSSTDKDVVITFRVDSAMKDKLELLASNRNMSISAYLRNLVSLQCDDV